MKYICLVMIQLFNLAYADTTSAISQLQKLNQGEFHQAPKLECIDCAIKKEAQCTLHLGWGHTRSSHKDIKKAVKNQECAGGIGMGCNSGDAGVGVLKEKKELWRFQRGSNGTWMNYDQQGVQSGGLNPLLLHQADYFDQKNLFNTNSYLGFMRLTQYHWLKLIQHSTTHMLGKTCEQTSVRFTCASKYDLNDQELNKRLYAFQNIPQFSPALEKKYSNDFAAMRKIKPLESCILQNGKSIDPQKKYHLPHKCGETLIFNSHQKISLAPHCLKWLEHVDRDITEHNWQDEPSNHSTESEQDQYLRMQFKDLNAAVLH